MDYRATEPTPAGTQQESHSLHLKVIGGTCGCDFRDETKGAPASKACDAAVSHKAAKSKRFRRSQAPPCSSSDSTIHSCSEGEDSSRTHRIRPVPSRVKPGTPSHGTQGVAKLQRSGTPKPGLNANPMLDKSSAASSVKPDGRTSKDGSPAAHPVPTPALQRKMNWDQVIPASIRESGPQSDKRRDSPMHFASSDINPFAHQWQEDEPSQRCHKAPAFGSAANLSCKSPRLDGAERRMTRCCSVDNGLNGQNSPFISHLSTYANHRGLSSTLSSIEDYNEQVSPAAPFTPSPSPSSGRDSQPANLTSDSSGHEASGGQGNSSGQVDEIVLVYSSEQESPACKTRGNGSGGTQEHGTQTEPGPRTAKPNGGDVGGDPRRRSRHARSLTQGAETRRAREALRDSSTWASLENMSAHLSHLIHSTSDLLEDVQGMRAGDALKASPGRSANVHYVYSKDGTQRECSTQTAVDIGVQTERASAAVENSIAVRHTSLREEPKSHEVKVTVKVIGAVPHQEQDTMKTYMGDRRRSMPDLCLNGSLAAEACRLQPGSLSPISPAPEAGVKCHRHTKCSCGSPNSTGSPPETVSPRDMTVSGATSKSSKDVSEVSRTPSRNAAAHPLRRLVRYTDRASSPILTVSTRAGPQRRGNHSEQRVQKNPAPVVPNQMKNKMSAHKESPPLVALREHQTGMSVVTRQHCDISSGKSIPSVSLENVSELSPSSPKRSDGCTTSLSSLMGSYSEDSRDDVSFVSTCQTSCSQTARLSLPSPRSTNGLFLHNYTSVTFRQSYLGKDRQRQEGKSYDNMQNYKRQSLELQPGTEASTQRCDGAYGPSSHVRTETARQLEDDSVSLTLSECNTDVLVNFQPLGRLSPPPDPSRPSPDDLPMHNKFTNWSGLGEKPPTRYASHKPTKATVHPQQDGREARTPRPGWEETDGWGPSPDYEARRDRRRREIERLRQEREQVMSTVHLNMNPQRLTVELTEAKLHYGLGETDTLLKMLSLGSREAPSSSSSTSPSPGCSSQQLYDRHRRSMEGLRQEREARLQIHRRARSLSPGTQPRSPPREARAPGSRASARPSRRKEYLQQLRQEVVDSTRVPDPPKGESLFPSEMEQLLRDYGRARQEARTEIARARERLRERTEQEKRRLQQQAMTQDELRHRTRVSNSTLCTGSCLSLSSGPTSGYNSGNATQLKDGGRTTLAEQPPGSQEESLKVRTRPPMCGTQSVKSQRAWLSAQDVRLESSVPGFHPLMSSSPSPLTPLRQRTASFGSASSISTAYQDIASSLLGRALAEVRLAAAGEMGNLVFGKATAGWVHQGSEGGVQAYYKASSSPSVHGFLGARELDRPLATLWSLLRQHSKTHLYHLSVRSAWTRPLDDSTQLVYLLTEPSTCHLKQPRDFCCISTESQQGGMWVLAMQSVFEESLPRPSVDAVRGEMMPSAWILQPVRRDGRDVVRVTYLLQVDLGPPSLPARLLSSMARRQAVVISELDALVSVCQDSRTLI